MQEEAEPRALAAARRARRGSCRRSSRRCRTAAGRARPRSVPLSIARTQCSNSVPSSARRAGRPYDFVLVGGEQRRLRGTARARRARRRRRSRARTRRRRTAARADRRSSACAARGRRLVPPVLHVAFDELPSGGAQQVLAREIRPREQQRHHVLQLIAEAERAARLVVAGARPEPAADRPDRAASGSSARRTNRPACAPGRRRACRPRRAARARARDRARVDASVTRDQLRGVLAIVALPEQEHASGGARQAAARIGRAAPRTDPAPAPNCAGERRLAHRGRRATVAVAADERPAIAGRRARRLARVRERDVARELLVVGIASRGSRRSPRRAR